MRGIGDREVEILGEAIGLKVAFLQRCPALENPGLGKDFVLVDAGERPAKHVVLFDDVG